MKRREFSQILLLLLLNNRSFQQKRAERVAYLKESTVELKKKLTLKVCSSWFFFV
jgi:hypothetical protein